MSFNLQVSPAVIEFLLEECAREAREMVLIVFGVALGSVSDTLSDDDCDTRSTNDLFRGGRELTAKLPRRIKVRLEVGTKEASRVPPNDLVVVDGIRCGIPSLFRPLLQDQRVVMEDGALVLKPGAETEMEFAV